MNNTVSYISVPLGKKAHLAAEQFAIQATSPEKGRQIYLNTLAVYAVHCYLDWLEIESNLERSDSWSLGIQNLSDIADLVIPGAGSLECRPILPEETSFIIPPQATEDRIGYVVVRLRLDKKLKQADLLGFLKAVVPTEQPQQISLNRLQHLDRLLELLPITIQTNPVDRVVVNLSRWLENTFENEWLRLEDIFNKPPADIVDLSLISEFSLSEFSTIARNEVHSRIDTVKRGKLIDLGIQLDDKKVALIVSCRSIEEEREIRLQVYPVNYFTCLPPNLQLTVLDEAGKIVPELQAKTRSADNCIQLEFTGEVGERFSVRISLGNISITENFQI